MEVIDIDHHDLPRAATPESIRDLWESDLDRETADAAIDESGDNARLLRALRSAPIPIIDTPVDETWAWSDHGRKGSPPARG